MGWRAARLLVLGLAIVVGLKVAAATTAPPIGLNARYWPTATPEGPPERSTDYPWLTDTTRIDATLDLRFSAGVEAYSFTFG